MRFVGLADTYADSADPDELLLEYGLTPEAVWRACHEVLKMKGRERA
jgi:transketolase C-terminal domain/subunit